MPARAKPLEATDGPLARFALQLRGLRDRSPAGRPTSVDSLARNSGGQVSRAAVYSALSGRTLPSRPTLAVMVLAWAPGRAADLAIWNERRSQCERELSLRGASTPAGAEPGSARDVVAGPTVAATRATFGAELRRRRQLAGLPLSDFARRVNYSKGYLSKVETGLSVPSLTLAALADSALDSDGALTRLAAEVHAAARRG